MRKTDIARAPEEVIVSPMASVEGAAASHNDAYDKGHLSDTVEMRHWLRLLVVVATFLLLLLAVAVAVKLMSYIGHTLLLFSLGGLLAYALDPLVEKARAGRAGRHTRMYSVFGVFGILIALMIGSGVLLSAELGHQVSLLAREHQKYEIRARQKLHDTDAWLATRNIHTNLEDTLNHPPPNVRTWGEAIASRVLKTAAGIGKAVVEGVIVLLIALYFLIYCGEMREGVNRALHPRVRAYAEQWENDVNRILGGFVRGQLLLALIMGALGGAICLLLGMHFWLIIGLFVVVASLIPVIGPYIGAIPAVIAALLMPTHGFMTPVLRAVIVLVLFAIMNEVGSKILYPKLVGAALGLHEVLVLFILFAGFEVGGLTGVLFAAPLTALSIVTLAQLYRLWQGAPPISLAAAARDSAIKARMKAEG